jgi:putative Holliday junction resolvase
LKNSTFLAFDYGEKHIGAAVGSAHTRTAQPIGAVPGAKGSPDWRRISDLVTQWQPNALIVGLPLNMDGTENTMTRAARRFGNRLRDRYNLPVHMVDERLSSRSAKDALIEAGIPAKRHKRKLDTLAARTILQSFLNDHLSGENDRQDFA